MEEYEKKYKEVLGRARTFSQRWDGIKVTDSELALKELKEIFPELKENEDEDKKARESLLKYLKESFNFDGEIIYPEVANWIAWLEKQGEQKPVFNKHIQEGDEIVINENGERVNISQLNRVAKPRGWVEDYWRHHKVNNPDSYDGGEEIQFDHDGFVRFCNTYCEKPDWSEEDEKTLNSILNDLSQNVIPDDEDIQWLKSLKERMKGDKQ